MSPKTWTNISISVSLSDYETVLEEIQTIAKRERKSRSAIIIDAMREYSDRHLKGNYQTLIPSYNSESNETNRALVERTIRNFYKNMDSKGFEIKQKDIVESCKKEVPNIQSALTMAERVSKWLSEQGVKVWR